MNEDKDAHIRIAKQMLGVTKLNTDDQIALDLAANLVLVAGGRLISRQAIAAILLSRR